MTYLLMALLGLLAFALVLARTAHKAELWAMYVVATALVALSDWIAFGWFQLYTYHPRLLAAHQPDAALGEFLADLLFVPAVSAALTATLPVTVAALLGTALFAVTEYALLRGGLFTHNGWHLGYSMAGFLVYFPVLAALWRSLTAGGTRPDWLPWLLRVSTQLVTIGLLTLFLRALPWVHTNIQIMPTRLGNQAFGRFITYALVTIPLGLWICHGRGAQRWTRLGLVTLGLTLYNAMLTRLNFQFFIPPWSGPLDALAQGVAIGAASLAANGILGRLEAEDRARV
jgi:hypothetical protein